MSSHPVTTSPLEAALNSVEMQKLRQSWANFEKEQNAADDAWWDSLDDEGRSRAMRQVAKIMHHAEVTELGTYRYAMEAFGADYCDGLQHYMDLHNLIHKGREAGPVNT